MGENKDLVDEIRRHIASAPAGATIDTFAYANAIESAFEVSLRDIRAIIRREAQALRVDCT